MLTIHLLTFSVVVDTTASSRTTDTGAGRSTRLWEGNDLIRHAGHQATVIRTLVGSCPGGGGP